MKMNEEQCNPPLDEAELEQIAASAAKHEPGAAPIVTRPRYWWFKLDVNEWFTEPRVMSMLDYQRGWYISLLAACWKTGGFLPNNPDKLARIAGAEDRVRFKEESADVLWPFETCDDEAQIVHSRLHAEWNDAVISQEQKKEAGKASAASRAKKGKVAA